MNEFLNDLLMAFIIATLLAGYVLLVIKMKWIQITANFDYEKINKYIEDKVAAEISKIKNN